LVPTGRQEADFPHVRLESEWTEQPGHRRLAFAHSRDSSDKIPPRLSSPAPRRGPPVRSRPCNANEPGTVKKLLNGIVDFRKKVRPEVKDTFALLALGQAPDALFIACSDSRVAANVFASTEPGDMFVIRNVGNLIPPYTEGNEAPHFGAEAAAIQFALANLPITDVIVCGHSECGAMAALEHGHVQGDVPALKCWLRHGKSSLQKLETGAELGNHLDRLNQLSQLNVLEQLEHLKSYPIVQQRLTAGLRLHGWYFDIKEANVYEYEPSEQRFHLLDEAYVATLLQRQGDRS
jgi:carbonic anhydrase